MKPYLLLAVIGMVGCAFGQGANNPVCVDVNEKGTTVHYEHSWANYEGLSPAQIAPAYEKLPKCIWPTSAVVEITEPAPKKPAGQKPAKKPFQCDPSKLQSCASQANDDYGPGRSGLVGELTQNTWGKGAVDYPDSLGPIDVPAIQVDDEWGNCTAGSGIGLHGHHYECLIPEHWTCKDKTRGLWHDEQEPPKYWCRRVQP